MANTIDQSFITDYDSDVHVAYQQFGSKFRNTIRLKILQPGQIARFPTLGRGTATDKSRNGDVVPMNPVHSYKDVTSTDKYAPEYVDKLDDIKNNIEERQLYARAGAGALGREVDLRVVTVMDATTHNSIAAGAVGLTKNKLLQAILALNSHDVPDDGDRWGALSAQAFEEFINITQVSSRDYVTDLNWTRGTQVINWRGIKWFFHSALPLSTTTRSNFLYHRTSVGLAENAAITTMVDWVPQKAAFLIDSMMSCGAVLIDGEGIVKIACDESSTALLA
ncbi:MAG: hypothetical protein IMZ61_15480 [Planctomycetes bacterium]|nr:hypothetical protein [Candidatus Atribacteria bacterium]MBE3145299.1 hypothetical protein [Planctomycetota bacterium]